MAAARSMKLGAGRSISSGSSVLFAKWAMAIFHINNGTLSIADRGAHRDHDATRDLATNIHWKEDDFSFPAR